MTWTTQGPGFSFASSDQCLDRLALPLCRTLENGNVFIVRPIILALVTSGTEHLEIISVTCSASLNGNNVVE